MHYHNVLPNRVYFSYFVFVLFELRCPEWALLALVATPKVLKGGNLEAKCSEEKTDQKVYLRTTAKKGLIMGNNQEAKKRG